MKKLLILAAGLLIGLSSCGGGNVPDSSSGYNSGSGQCYVNGYTRKDGTRVTGYYRKC